MLQRFIIRWDLVNAITMARGAIPMVAQATTTPLTSDVPFTRGETCKVRYNFKSKCIGESTGEILDPELIRAEIIDELDYFKSQIWQIKRE